MFDRAVSDGIHDNGLSAAETRKIVSDDIRQNLGPSCPEKVYLTSARHPTKYDLESLLADISEALNGVKRERFVADMGAYSEDALKKSGR